LKEIEHATILKSLENLYSREVNIAIEKYLQKVSNKEEVSQFLNRVFGGTRHQALAESNTTLFLSLSNPSVDIRLAAIRKLKQIDPAKEKKVRLFLFELFSFFLWFSLSLLPGQQFLEAAYLSALSDSEKRVLQEALKAENLVRVVEPSGLFEKLRQIFISHHGKHHLPLSLFWC
jgi:hypothetical protein